MTPEQKLKNNQRSKLWNSIHKEHNKKLNRERRQAHQKEWNEYCKKRKKIDPRGHRNRHLKRTYKITLEQYEEMFRAQGGTCYVCKEPKKLGLDHNHATGQIRKFLCGDCNRGIGLFKENIGVLEATIEYLKEHATVKSSSI